MKLKRIQAATVQDAMALARRELGEDAALLDTKKIASGVIVTFAVEVLEENVLLEEAEAVVAAAAPPTAVRKPITKQTVREAVKETHPAHDLVASAIAHHSIAEPLRGKLIEHVARSPVHRAMPALPLAEQLLTHALLAELSFAPLDINAKIPPDRAWMFVGAHGAGKTSTIAKVATALALAKKPVMLISTDTERLGGAESLEILAKLLKCPFVIARSREELQRALEASIGQYWVLVDTSGANIYAFDQLKQLGELASLAQVEPILVAASGMDAAEAVEMAGVFNFLTIERMVITRLDAIRRLGSVFATLTAGRYHLAQYTDSAIPTDSAKPLSHSALATLMLRHVRDRMGG